MLKTYRSENGRFYFSFRFVPENGCIAIYCVSRPSINGQDPDPHKTHLFPSGRICIAEGHDPTMESRAEELAKQWAEYYLEYRRTGVPQS